MSLDPACVRSNASARIHGSPEPTSSAPVTWGVRRRPNPAPRTLYPHPQTPTLNRWRARRFMPCTLPARQNTRTTLSTRGSAAFATHEATGHGATGHESTGHEAAATVTGHESTGHKSRATGRVTSPLVTSPLVTSPLVTSPGPLRLVTSPLARPCFATASRSPSPPASSSRIAPEAS
eukprot:3106016-Rhodomonas_salina.1